MKKFLSNKVAAISLLATIFFGVLGSIYSKTDIFVVFKEKDGNILKTLLMEEVVKGIFLVNGEEDLTTFGEKGLSYDLSNVYYEMLNGKAVFIQSALVGSKHPIATVKKTEFKEKFSDWEPNIGYVATENQKSESCFLVYESVEQIEFNKKPRVIAHVERGPLFYKNPEQCYKQKTGDFDGFIYWKE